MGQGIAKDHVSDEDYVDGDDAEEDDDDAEEDDADDKDEAETSVVTDGKAGSEDDVNVIEKGMETDGSVAASGGAVDCANDTDRANGMVCISMLLYMLIVLTYFCYVSYEGLAATIQQFVLTARNQAEVEASAKPRQAKCRGRPQTDNRILGDVSETGAAPSQAC
ncbi:unnamed protein product [Phytophthora fragariaefolia]|uniref:Unnamed protein product n=1 Tax=Phytophthora fragariaefolia TaxID=1490495 RepID=A0A9W7D0A9_9STRA|nr:unnamed protein product [Phytophthora fragariaefolia]